MKRVKYKRGTKLSVNTKYVGRPSEFGNPFAVGKYYGNLAVLCLYGFGFTAQEIFEMKNLKDKTKHGLFVKDNQMAVELYEIYFTYFLRKKKKIRKLHGKDLACWCGPDEFCHADYLLNFVKYTFGE